MYCETLFCLYKRENIDRRMEGNINGDMPSNEWEKDEEKK